MQAKFWVPMDADSLVRVKVSPGHPIEWFRESRTEEGWQAEGARYYIEGDELVRESHSDGRDCDGRFATYTVTACRLDRLDAHAWEGIGFPAWQVREEEQRDYSAEAMGY